MIFGEIHFYTRLDLAWRKAGVTSADAEAMAEEEAGSTDPARVYWQWGESGAGDEEEDDSAWAERCPAFPRFKS